ncbi:MAG: hypothetical protein AAB468_00960 [Patescibacteria group bacterium]
MFVRKSQIVSENKSDVGKEEAYLHRIHELLSDGWLIFHVSLDHDGPVIKLGRPVRSTEE